MQSWSSIHSFSREKRYDRSIPVGIPDASRKWEIKVDGLASTLQVCLDSGAKRVLIPSTSFVDFATVPPDLMSAFQLIPYQSAEDAVFKALGVE